MNTITTTPAALTGDAARDLAAELGTTTRRVRQACWALELALCPTPHTTTAGLETRMYVRGALDPTYATPQDRDAYVRLLATTAGPTVAAAFLAGWVTRTDPDPTRPVLAWGRLIGTTRVLVTGATA